MTTTEHAPSRGTAPAGEAGTATRTGRGRRREGRAAWVLALPFCALFLTFTMWPVVQSLFMSFTDTRARDLRHPFAVDVIGLDNYAKALTDPTFLQAARNTAYFVIVGVPLTLVHRPGGGGRAGPRHHPAPVGVPAGLLHAGDHLHRRGRGGVAVPAAE